MSASEEAGLRKKLLEQFIAIFGILNGILAKKQGNLRRFRTNQAALRNERWP